MNDSYKIIGFCHLCSSCVSMDFTVFVGFKVIDLYDEWEEATPPR